MNYIWKLDDLEKVICEICGKDGVLVPQVQRSDRLIIVECKNCGLAFLNPRPKAFHISRLYSKDYFDGSLNSNNIGYSQKYLNNLTPKIAPILLEFIGLENLKNRKILEIGCASGILLAALRSFGAEVFGIEPVKEVAKIAISNFNLKIINDWFENVNLPKNYFDIIIAMEVIEHVLSPKFFLTKAFNLLKSNGILILSTPNYDAGKYIGPEWIGFRTSLEHIYYFSASAIRKLSENVGFNVVKIKSIGLANKHNPASKLKLIAKLIPGSHYIVKHLRKIQTKHQEKLGMAHSLYILLKKP